jgi:hypothetical protein
VWSERSRKAGTTAGTVFAIGAVYAAGAGFATSRIATFMACGIFAAVVIQLPLGRLSDGVDRRAVLAAMSGHAANTGYLEEPALSLFLDLYRGPVVRLLVRLHVYALSSNVGTTCSLSCSAGLAAINAARRWSAARSVPIRLSVSNSMRSSVITMAKDS